MESTLIALRVLGYIFYHINSATFYTKYYDREDNISITGI